MHEEPLIQSHNSEDHHNAHNHPNSHMQLITMSD